MSVCDDKLLDNISREIHWYIAYATVTTYYMMKKALDSTETSESREKAAEIVDKMLSLSETRFEDLNDEQKELMKTLALKMFDIVNGKD